jgi:hypothetical protein
VRLPEPAPLDAISLVAPAGGPPLPRSFDLEVSADGVAFQTMAQRRRREERSDLRWVNGHPQYVTDMDLVAVPLGGLWITAVAVAPSDAGAVGEILLHVTRPAGGEGDSLAAWPEWLPPVRTWEERRRLLAATPRTDREDWYYRTLLASRQ